MAERILAARRENVASAFRAIVDNKLRSFLTCLGIIIGVATVIVMVALIDGFNQQFIASFQSFGATMVQFQKKEQRFGGGPPPEEERLRPNLTLEDAEAIRRYAWAAQEAPRRHGPIGGYSATPTTTLVGLPVEEAAGQRLDRQVAIQAVTEAEHVVEQRHLGRRVTKALPAATPTRALPGASGDIAVPAIEHVARPAEKADQRPKPLTRNFAIWSRRTRLVGQYVVGRAPVDDARRPQVVRVPAVRVGREHVGEVQARRRRAVVARPVTGSVYAVGTLASPPAIARATNIAIALRVTLSAGQ